MGAWDSLKAKFQKEPVKLINNVPVSGFATGTSGTEIYGGYIEEEVIRDLRGTQGAKKFAEMRRSDANLIMILRAVKLPIRSAQWDIVLDENLKEEQKELAKKQQELLRHILFKDMGKPWSRFMGEALTFIDFGYSVFEKTYKPVLNHKDFGSYIGVKSLGFRKQQTIERWIVDECGNLQAIEQQTYGDNGRIVCINAEHLIHFSPDQEGDNFEGMSFLRPCYGNWFRKNLFLKLLAAGIEKYSIPIPIMTVPTGKENSPELEEAKKVLRAYTSNQTNFITVPTGWTLDMKVTQIDPAKIRETIKEENQEMVNSVLASFLLLGQNQSGSYSLSSTLGDFFGTCVQFLGDHVCEGLNNGLVKDLVKLNFGSECLVKLKVEGIKDSASNQFADILQKLLASGAITKDSELEKFVREKYKLPTQAVPLIVPGLTPPANPLIPPKKEEPGDDEQEEPSEEESEPEEPKELQFSEGKRVRQSDLIRNSAYELRDFIEGSLGFLGASYIEKLRKAYKQASTDAQKSKVPNDVELTVPPVYREILAHLSLIQAHQAVAPIKQGKKLASVDERMDKIRKMLIELREAQDDYEATRTVDAALKVGYLTRSIRSRISGLRAQLDLKTKTIASIKSRVETMAITQVADLKKAIDLQYQASVSSTDSERTLFGDLEDKRSTFMSSPVITTGPDILASQNLNESILKETEGEPEVESYTFVAVDDDSTTDICRELNGRTFSKDDPELFRLHPPLHHNCRSYMAVNLKSFKDNPAITEEPLRLTKAAQSNITLAEETRRMIFGKNDLE